MPPKKITKAATPATPAAPAAPAVEKSEVKGSGTAKAAPAPRTPSYEDISVRAFEIYAGRGYAEGDRNADWFEAERQLKAGL